MSLSPQEQFKKFLESSKETLILIPENPSADAIGSAWGLYWFLKKRNTLPTIAFPNHLSQKFDFLSRPKNIQTEISGARDFILSFNTEHNKIIRIRQEEKDNQFNILVTPEKGSINPRDFSFIPAKFKYDLIVVINSPDLEKLGKLYTKNTDLFFEVPIINIDSHSNNDHFGQINLVDVTASSAAEILARFFENFSPKEIDKKIATCFLTGIIGATNSFQKKNTTPKTLSISANLMNKEADQQEIIRWLYKTHPLHILKLWGRAMAKINWDSQSKLAWSNISVEDFVQSRSDSNDLPLIIEKLEENYSEGHIFMLLYNDTPKTAIALIKDSNPEEMEKIHSQFRGVLNHNLLKVKIDQANLDELGKAIALKIKGLVNNQR